MGCGGSAPVAPAEPDPNAPLYAPPVQAPPARAAAAKEELERIKAGTQGKLTSADRVKGEESMAVHDSRRFQVDTAKTETGKDAPLSPETKLWGDERSSKYATDRGSPVVKLAGESSAKMPLPKAESGITTYGPLVAPHMASIEALFKCLDKDSNGYLVKSELKDVVAQYNCAAFDEKQFFGWYDVHGPEAQGGPDGQVGLTEFAWYLADVALSFGSGDAANTALGTVIRTFTKLADPEGKLIAAAGPPTKQGSTPAAKESDGE